MIFFTLYDAMHERCTWASRVLTSRRKRASRRSDFYLRKQKDRLGIFQPGRPFFLHRQKATPFRYDDSIISKGRAKHKFLLQRPMSRICMGCTGFGDAKPCKITLCTHPSFRHFRQDRTSASCRSTCRAEKRRPARKASTSSRISIIRSGTGSSFHGKTTTPCSDRRMPPATSWTASATTRQRKSSTMAPKSVTMLKPRMALAIGTPTEPKTIGTTRRTSKTRNAAPNKMNATMPAYAP